MFKKLLNVGKGHSAAANDKLQQQQQQQKNLFQLNEIRSYGFSHLCCLGYSSSLSLLAVGSKYGLLRVLGNSSVEFSHQLESGNSIRQIEFIDCRSTSTSACENNKANAKRQNDGQKQKQQQHQVVETTQKAGGDAASSTSAKIVVLTDNGQLHLFELKTVRQQNFADNTTQTGTDCCQQQSTTQQQLLPHEAQQQNALEFTKLERVAYLDYFRFKPDYEDRSRRITTLEVAADGQTLHVGTEGGNLYLVPLSKFEPLVVDIKQQQDVKQSVTATGASGANDEPAETTTAPKAASEGAEAVAADQNFAKDDETTAVNLNDEPQIEEALPEPFEMIKFDEDVVPQLGDDVKAKKQGAIESIKRHPASNGKILLSYHRGLNVIYDIKGKSLDKYFYHNQVLESSCFADQNGDYFYTSHNDGSYIKWDTRQGSQAKANDDFLGQLYGPYPCKPTPKIQAATGLVNDQLEDLVIFSGGMPRATYDDKNPVTIVRAEADGKDTIKTVLDFTSKVLDFVVITRPRGNLGAGAKSTGGGGGGKKNKHKKQEQQQQQRNNPIVVALAILAEEEFVIIDLLNSESYLEFPLPYLNCVHSSAITCNQHYSNISDELYEQLQAYNKLQLKNKLSLNEWPITGGKVIDAPEVKSHDILLTGHEDGSVDFWDVSDLSMRHLLHLSTARFFSTTDDDLVPIDGQQDSSKQQQDAGQDSSTKSTEAGAKEANNENNSNQQDSNSRAWPPLKRVGRFDPYSDDTRLAIRRLSLCPKTGTLVVAGTGGQVLVLELKNELTELETLMADQITIVNDPRFPWKGREKLATRPGVHKFEPGFQLTSYVQLEPPVAATSLDLRSDWRLYALGTSYGFVLYDYANKHSVVTKSTLNQQDYAIVGGDLPGAGAISRKKSFRKSLRESFRRLRRGRSQRNQSAVSATGGESVQATSKPAFSRVTTGVRALNSASGPTTGVVVGQESSCNTVHRNVYQTERQVEPKVELSSIVKCITLTSAVITNNLSFKPTLWVGTNSGQVLVYSINLASEQQQEKGNAQAVDSTTDQQQEGAAVGEPPVVTTAKLAKEIQLKHRAPIIAIFTSPEEPQQQPVAAVASAEQSADTSTRSSPEKQPELAVSVASNNRPEPSKLEQAEPAAAAAVTGAEGSSIEQPRAQSPTQVASEKSPVSSPKKDAGGHHMQPRVLICSEEQFKVFNLPNLKPFCKFKLTAHEGLRAKKISITQFLKPQPTGSSKVVVSANTLSVSKSLQSFATQTSPPASPLPPAEGTSVDESAAAANGANNSHKTSENNNNSLSALNNNHVGGGGSSSSKDGGSKELMNAKFGAKTTTTSTSFQNERELAAELLQQQQDACNASFEPYMVCMSNQGDCAIYSVPDLKRQAQVQVCKREDVNGITSTMLTNYGEGYYLKSSSNFLRFSISTQRVPRILSVV